MALNLEVCSKAPCLPIDISTDLLYALEVFCSTHGNKEMTQAALKALQCLPICWAALAVKESWAMKKDKRNYHVSKCMQEVALPGWIKLLERAIAESNGTLVLPKHWKHRLYYTTLGKGSASAKTFMQVPKTAFSKFNKIKAAYTKGPQLWFSNNTIKPADLPSDTNTQDYLEKLHVAMWLASDQYKKCTQLSAEGMAFLEPAPASTTGGGGAAGVSQAMAAAGVPRGTPEPGESSLIASTAPAGAGAGRPVLGPLAAAALLQARNGTPSEPVGTTQMGTNPRLLAMAAATNIRKERTSVSGSAPGPAPGPDVEGYQPEEGVPDEVPCDYFYPFLLMAAAWSPWSECTPGEWRYLDPSDGPLPPSKRKCEDDVVVQPDAILGDPSVIHRVDATGEPVSRRKQQAAIQQQKEQEKKEEVAKENKLQRKESLDVKKKGLLVMESATKSVESIGANLAKMVELKEQGMQASKRKTKIENLEKMLMLGIGNREEHQSNLISLLTEE